MELNSSDEISKKPITLKSHPFVPKASLQSSISNPQFCLYNNLHFWDDKNLEYDWFGDVNDEVVERIGVSVGDFKNLSGLGEVGGGVGGFKNVVGGGEVGNGVDGFRDLRDLGDVRDVRGGGEMGGGVEEEGRWEMVCGRRNRRNWSVGDGSGELELKVKKKIPFHIASIRKPQDEYKIIVNNANQPFEHVWLERSEDGIAMHPLEKFSPLDFMDRNVLQVEPIEPPPLERTPFKIVEEVKDLKELATKLRNVHEFAVDLEHNQYRSFQGLTCLMQISTRNEDFVIDTLKLRIHIGPYMRELFKDPTKRKVMHGADKDVLWLQRDFGIYICNMFDTGQASKVLNLERNSLEYLLNHFCGVEANKEYQNADWRLRPLPDEMLKYAREDTHYLLYIYDLMRNGLLSLDAESECPGTSLLEVYTRSYSTCMLLYEKDLLTEISFRNVYGVPGAGLSAEQLAVVDALCKWRDVVARSEDESTGFILPNRTLVEIAKEMPLTTSKLRRFVRSKHPYVEHNLSTVVSIIRTAILSSASFEAAAVELKLNPKEPEQMKLEQIISAVNLPFLPFLATADQSSSKAEDMTSLNSSKLPNDASSPVEEDTIQTEHICRPGSASENDEGDDTMSLSDLSSSFQKCSQSMDQSRRSNPLEKSKGHEGGLLQLDRYDYEAARTHVIFGKASRGEEEGDDNKKRNRNRNRMGKGQYRKSS